MNKFSWKTKKKKVLTDLDENISKLYCKQQHALYIVGAH